MSSMTAEQVWNYVKGWIKNARKVRTAPRREPTYEYGWGVFCTGWNGPLVYATQEQAANTVSNSTMTGLSVAKVRRVIGTQRWSAVLAAAKEGA